MGSGGKGLKRKSGDMSLAGAYIIECKRNRYVEEIDEDVFLDCHGSEYEATESMLREDISKKDGRWKYKDIMGHMLVFKSLETANKYAQTAWEELLEEDYEDGEPAEDDGDEDLGQCKTTTPDGLVGYKRDNMIYMSSENDGLKHLVISTIQVTADDKSYYDEENEEEDKAYESDTDLEQFNKVTPEGWFTYKRVKDLRIRAGYYEVSVEVSSTTEVAVKPAKIVVYD